MENILKEKITESEYNYAVHPGKILKKFLSNLNMKQKELAEKTGINKTIINELIKGKRSFTLSVANKLEPVFEMPAKFWRGLQFDYDEAMERLRGNVYSETYQIKNCAGREVCTKIEIETKSQILCAI